MTITRPTVVCLCGSMRFSEAFQEANLRETLAGNIVLTIGCDMRLNTEVFAEKSEEERAAIKAELDALHLRKIDLADEILVLNVGGYIGESTQREIAYAEVSGKPIRYLEPHAVKQLRLSDLVLAGVREPFESEASGYPKIELWPASVTDVRHCAVMARHADSDYDTKVALCDTLAEASLIAYALNSLRWRAIGNRDSDLALELIRMRARREQS